MSYKTIRHVKTCLLPRFNEVSPPVNMRELMAMLEESDEEMSLDLCYRRVRRVLKSSRGTQTVTDTDMEEEKENEGVNEEEEEEECLANIITPSPSLPPTPPYTLSDPSDPSDPSRWTESQVSGWLRSIGVKEAYIEMLHEEEVDGKVLGSIDKVFLCGRMSMKVAPAHMLIHRRDTLFFNLQQNSHMTTYVSDANVFHQHGEKGCVSSAQPGSDQVQAEQVLWMPGEPPKPMLGTPQRGLSPAQLLWSHHSGHSALGDASSHQG